MTPLDLQHIYYILSVHPKTDGEPHRSLLGKFILHDGQMHVLEDHGLDHNLKTLTPERAARYIYSLSRGQRTEVVSLEDIRQGLHPHLLPTVDKPRQVPTDLRDAIGLQLKHDEQEGPKTSRYLYHRHGLPAPQQLEVYGGTAYLDGHRLAEDELQAVMANLKSGRANLRHPQKSDLQKIEPGLAQALQAMNQAVASGGMHPDHARTLTRHIFSDTLVPVMGNKLAYEDFLSRPKKGVHIHMDGNDFGSVNKFYSHEVGDKAIVGMGRAIREAMDEAVGRKHGKIFRTGGDEFVAHVPSGEHAAAFSRALRSKLEAIPAIGGTHQLSMSVGYGAGKDQAEQALQSAKAEKKAAAKPLGQAATHVVAHPEPTSGG